MEASSVGTLIRDGYAALSRADLDALLPRLHEDLEVYPARDGEGAMRGSDLKEVYRGRDGLLEWFRDWMQAWASFEFHPEEYVELPPDVVIVLIRQKGRGRVSGMEVEENDVAHLWRFDGTTPRVLRVFNSRSAAFEAAGVRAADSADSPR